MPDLPLVDQTFVSRIFSALSEMELALDENPLQYGPRRLNKKVAQARDMLTEVEQIYNQVAHLLQRYKRAHRTAETVFKLEMDSLLANDPEVRAGRNLETSKAIARVKLRTAGEVADPEKLESTIEDLVTVQAVVKAKRSDLKDLQARIRDQIKLCHEEIGLGSQWGSKAPPGSKAPKLGSVSRGAKTTFKDLRKMFQGVEVDGEDVVPAEAEDETPEEAPAPEPAPEKGFEPLSLEGGEDAPTPPSDDALEELLSGSTTSDEEADGFLEALDEEGGPEEGSVAKKARQSPDEIERLLREFGV